MVVSHGNTRRQFSHAINLDLLQRHLILALHLKLHHPVCYVMGTEKKINLGRKRANEKAGSLPKHDSIIASLKGLMI